MSTVSDPSLRVLLALRLTSFAPVETVASVAAVEVAEALGLLETFRDKGWVRFREGTLTGWMLVAAGRAEGERMLADEVDAAGVRTEIEAAYRDFLAVNQPFLQVCTDWQLIERDGAPVTNDHEDAAYDAAVVARLRALIDQVQPVCAALTSALTRFEVYGPRFDAAVTRVEAGEVDRFTRPSVDSVHTIWFELHENLLATLGIERGSETTP